MDLHRPGNEPWQPELIIPLNTSPGIDKPGLVQSPQVSHDADAVNQQSVGTGRDRSSEVTERWGVDVPWYYLGAKSLQVWQTSVDTPLTLYRASGERDQAVELAAFQHARRCAETNQPQSSIITVPDRQLCYTFPLAGDRRRIVTINFSWEASRLDGAFSVALQQMVAGLVEREFADTCPGNDSADVSQASPLTWAELALGMKAKFVELLFQRHDRWKKIAGVAIFLTGLLCIPLPYRVRCEVVAEPAVRRTISAPLAGQIERTLLRPGDVVKVGDLLCTLDDDELQKEIASLRASRDQQLQKLNASLAASDHSKAASCRLEAEFFANKIAILEKQLEDLRICSPIHGVVVAGDLERAVGSTVSQGEALCEVAALDDMIVEVAIPEADILRVSAGMVTDVTWEAEHLPAVSVTLDSIHLRSELREQQSVFIAEAHVDNSTGTLRPGMSGWASVATGKRPLGWILFHRPLHRLRQWTGW